MNWERLADSFEAMVIRAIAPLKTRLDALEAKTKAIEASHTGMIYAGVWSEHNTFARNNMVTRNGSLWLALRDAPGRPGDPDSGWRLIVKGDRERERAA